MIDNLDFARLRAIGLAPALFSTLANLPDTPVPQRLMRVTEVQRDSVTGHDGSAEQRARLRPALHAALADAGDALAVGDWALAERNAFAEWWLVQRVPPANQIARRLHDGRDKVTRTVIVANVDTALLVMGLDHDFNPRRLERYLAFVRLAQVGAVVVLTKADLCADVAAREREVQAILPPDVACVAVTATAAAAAHALAPWLGAGLTLVLVGSSGAGKSTLTNTLVGTELQDTGGTRRGDGRGRHTTSARSLFITPQGACIIDTPGLRTLRLDGDPDAVTAAFDDVAALAMQCRFRDCRHEDDPGCAVRDALPAARLKNFHKLRREAERDAMSALERKALVATWKARSKAGRERAKEKKRA
jgi:ribosome biogenesis GTPase / thiamine phosphate phosphatase